MWTGEWTVTWSDGVWLFSTKTGSWTARLLVWVSRAYNERVWGPSSSVLVSRSPATAPGVTPTASGLSRPSTDSAQRPKFRSLAVPVTWTIPARLAWAVGKVRTTAGGVVSTTLMVELAVPTLPWASTAWKWIVVRPIG